MYLAPIVFKDIKISEHSNSNVRDLNFLVFSLRSLYESDQHTDLCGRLLDSFCRSMSKKYPLKSFESINFHLLRHLSWQCETFGPLWVTSATAFESANHHLIRPVTGSVNICKLLAERYIRNKEIFLAAINQDALKNILREDGENMSKWQTFALVRNSFVKEIESTIPDSRVFCRFRVKSIFPFTLDSVSYRRSQSNSFILFSDHGIEAAQILLFFDIRGGQTMGYVQMFKIVEIVDLDLIGTEFSSHQGELEPLAYIVQQTSKQKIIEISAVQNKLLKFEYKHSIYLIKLLKHFEHD